MDSSHILLVYQQPGDDERVSMATRALKQRFGMDPFMTRQHLVGLGPELIKRGSLDELIPIRDLLSEYGISAWISPVPKDERVCHMVSGYDFDRNELTLETKEEPPFTVLPGASVLVVLTDYKIEEAGQAVYRWTMLSQASDPKQEILNSMLHKNPVAIFFIRNPGDHQWHCFHIESRYTSTRINRRIDMDFLLSHFQKHAGDFFVDPYFGINKMPRSRHERGAKKPNLRKLYIYGLYLLPGFEKMTQNYAQAHPASYDPPKTKASNKTQDQAPVIDLPEPKPPVAAGVLTNNLGFRAVVLLSLIVALINSHGMAAARKSFHLEHSELVPVWDENVVIMLMLVNFAFAAVFMWRAFKLYRIGRWVTDTPTSRIRSLASGMVEVVGRAVRHSNLIAPMSGRACVYYRLTKYRKTYDLRGRVRFVMVNDVHTETSPFWIRDETGQVMVMPQGAEFICDEKTKHYTGSGITSSNEMIVEAILPEFSTVYCMGFAKTVRSIPTQSIKERVIKRLRALKSDKKALMKYDLDHNGRIDADEWDLARRDVEKQVIKESLEHKKDAEIPVMTIAKPDIKGLPFIISSGKPKRVAKKFFRYAALVMIPGLGTLVVALMWLSKLF